MYGGKCIIIVRFKVKRKLSVSSCPASAYKVMLVINEAQLVTVHAVLCSQHCSLSFNIS